MTTLLATLRPSLRLRTVALAALFTFTTFFVQLAPTEVPLPRPEALTPQPVAALGCADEPAFTGFITNTYTTTPATYSTTGMARGYISNVLDDWSCTAYYRYDGLAWMRDDGEGDANYQWGTLINSTSVPCNWVVGETTYLKANGEAHCHTSDSDHGMQLELLNWTGQLQEMVWHADSSPDSPGDFMFVHSDCTSYYAGSGTPGERMRWNVSFASTDVVNRPGDNCDPSVIDGTGTSQSIVVDGTPPVVGFDWPAAGGPALVTSAFAGVKFDATDNVAGFSGASDWDLQRQKATWSGSACGTFANDPATGSLVSGTTNAVDQVSSQGLLDNTCYRWTLVASDANGNDATTITSGSIRTSLVGNLGQQPQHTFESWDLGAGDGLAVNVGTGNLVVSHPIVDLPMRGGSFSLGLTYNRHDTSNVGMGPGWRLDAFRRLAIDAGTGAVTFTDGDGSRHVFSVASTVGTVTTYNRPATMYATLVKDTSQGAEFTLTYRDKSSDVFDLFGTTAAVLLYERDRFGNQMAFSYMASTTNIDYATDPAGRIVDFAWDTAPTPDRLTSIKDWVVVSGGVVQTSGTPNRTHRFFYDGSGNLAGWADPLNSTDSCPTGGNHVTCISYPTGELHVSKSQRIATLSAGVLGTANRTGGSALTTKVAFDGLDVRTVKDAQETSNATAGTAFSHAAPYQTQVIRRGTVGSSLDTTTGYTLTGAGDAHARIGIIKRKLGAGWITTSTTYNASYPIEVATVTEDVGGSLQRSTTTTYVASAMGLVARIDAPLDGTYRHYTDFTYNANNDVTQQIVSRGGDATLRTTTRNCYSATTCGTADNDLRLFRTIDNYVDGTKGGANGNFEDVTVEYQYDGFGQRIRETRHNYAPGGTLLDSRATGFEYDANGNQTKHIDNYASGTVTNPGDDITPNGTTNARTDLTNAHSYDTAGNRVSTADPRRAIESAKGTTLGADDFVTRWTYDSLDQRLTEKTPTTPGITIAQKTRSDVYDELGQVRHATDFGGLVMATEYDRVGRPTRVIEDTDGTGPEPAAATSATTYDPSGRVISAKDHRQVGDPLLGSTAYTYDELGRVTDVTEASGVPSLASTTHSTYDALDREASEETAYGTATAQRTTYTYDAGDRVTATDDEFSCTTQSYDYRGLATSTVEGRAGNGCGLTGSESTMNHTHDGLGRRTRDEIPGAVRTLDDTFDAAGNRLSSKTWTFDEGTLQWVTTRQTDYTVNPLDEVSREAVTSGATTKWTFDPTGSVADVCRWESGLTVGACLPAGSSPWTNPPTDATSSAYDALNQLVSLTDGTTGVTTTYEPNHNYQTSAKYLPTGSGREHQTLYGYDDHHRLASVTHQLCVVSTGHGCSATTATGSNSYVYDANDNRTQVIESNGTTSSDRRYCYDALNRLRARNTGAACTTTTGDETYTYDAAGNRTQAFTFGTPMNAAYDASGRLCKVGATTCGTPNVEYDAAGRITEFATNSGGGWRVLSHDGEGRILEICDLVCTGQSLHFYFAYDADGRRTTKEYTEGGFGGTSELITFRYDGDAITAEYVDGVLAREYLVDESGGIVKMVIPPGQQNPGTYIVNWNGHGDALGLWRIKSDGSLELANSFLYGTWGGGGVQDEAINSATGLPYGDLGFTFLYAGQFGVQYDDFGFGLDLHYMRARHYSPEFGRFLQPDPSAQEANLYGYANQNPVTNVDPTGKHFIDSDRGGGGGGGGRGGGGRGGGGRGGTTPRGKIEAILKPGGEWVGVKGTSPTTRVVSSPYQLRRLVVRMRTALGPEIRYVTRSAGRTTLHLRDGGTVTFRSFSKSGGPVIEVRSVDGLTKKIHVVKGS